MSYILPILSLVALLFGWVLFQEWLKRRDPEQFGYKPGCGACANKEGCAQPKPIHPVQQLQPPPKHQSSQDIV
jgi:hypothetical protein